MSNAARVFVPDKERVWVPAELLSSDGASVTVDVLRPSADGPLEGSSTVKETVTLALEAPYGDASALPLQNEGLGPEGATDMVSLDYLHEASVLYNLRTRYFRELPYTYTGTMCIAINPYQWLSHLYRDADRAAYLDRPRSELPPHVYAISAAAYVGVSETSVGGASTGLDQSILVSGESGAGKTETVKIMMSHLASVAAGADGAAAKDGVVERVLQSQPLLESFGNAKTVRNDNSSRFGKFTQLEFDVGTVGLRGDRPPLVGSRCRTYLLEKSRVVQQAPGERTYHCFYGVARGENDPSGCAPDLAALRYTRESDLDTGSIEGVPDGDRHAKTWDALALVGVEDGDRAALARCLGAILVLGDVDFEATDAADDDCGSSRATAGPAAERAALALGVRGDGASPVEALSLALTERTMRARSEVYKVPLNAQAARDARDALAKEIYVRAFDWIVKRINASTSSSGETSTSGGDLASLANGVDKVKVVGLLDIFGFESFAVNRFEQLCINYTNEKLQQKFTLDLFKTVQQEYDDERVPWTHVAFPDNAAVLALIDGRMGVIDVLNEECVRPRGSDEGFVSKMKSLHGSATDESGPSARFVAARIRKDQFTVKHYAGDVTYTAEKWLERNNDTLMEDLNLLARHATFKLLAELFAPQAPAANLGGGAKRRGSTLVADTVCTKFKSQLSLLMETIEKTKVQYVRCVKPNTVKSKANYDLPMVVDQLRCAGVIEAIRVARAGYPNKLPHAEFARRFAVLAETPAASAAALAQDLLGDAASDSYDGAYAVGVTRVYFKAGALEGLERLRAAALGDRATKAQAAWRRVAAVKRWTLFRRGVVLVSARSRRATARAAFLRLKVASIIAQSARRSLLALRVVKLRRRVHRATKIAAAARRRAAASAYAAKRRSAVVLQTSARKWSAVAAFVVALAEAKEQAKMENQLAAMEKKLRDMEASKAEAAAEALAKAQATLTPVVDEAAVAALTKELDDLKAQRTAEGVEYMTMLQQLRGDNDKLRKEADALRREAADLKRKVADLEAGQALKSDWMAAARSMAGADAAPPPPKRGGSPRGDRKAAVEETPAKPAAAPAPGLFASSAPKQSRFSALVGSLGFGAATPTPKKAADDAVSATPASSTKKDKRAPHIARPLNRFWQDIPAGSLASALPRAGHPEDAGSIHLKVGGQYLCATGSRGCAAAKDADSPAKPPPQSDAADACYLRCEPPVSVSSQLALANGKSASAGKGGDFGYRTAMAFKVERVGDGAFVDGATDEGFGVVSPGRDEELLSGATFRLRSELTGGYVCVGGLFQRYCLCASASSPADAATFQFVARRKPDDGAESSPDRGLEDLAVVEAAASTPKGPGRDTSMERLRARQLLVALRVVDGPKAGHFVRVRPDAYVNVAPPASADAARGSLAPDDRATPLLSVELLVPLQSYEITFVSSQLGLIVSKTMPLKVVRFKDVGNTTAPAAELSGRIGVGDVLAAADGKDLLNCSRREAVDVITSTRPITIGFQVARPEPPPSPAQDLLTG